MLSPDANAGRRRAPAGRRSRADATVDPTATISAFAVIGAGARVGARTIVHPHVVIGDGTTIGADCILHAHVSIRERCTIGARVIVQNGAVVGSDGYGFAQRADGTHEKIPQTGAGRDRRRRRDRRQHDDRSAGGRRDADQGGHEDRQPGADRARRGARHATSLLAAQVGIAGSTVIGDSVDVRRPGRRRRPPDDRRSASRRWGSRASPIRWTPTRSSPAIRRSTTANGARSSAVFRKLPEMRKQLRALEERLEALEEKTNNEERITTMKKTLVLLAGRWSPRRSRSGTCRCRRRCGRRSSNTSGWCCPTAWSSSCTRTSRRRSCTSSSGITSARRTRSRAAPASRISSST